MKKGFTLIELLAVIVILSIILLIAVPIVLRVIKDSKKSTLKDNLELYGRAVEQGVANYFLKNPEEDEVTMEELEKGEYIQYKGTKVECKEVQIYERNVYLASCKVGDTNIDDTYGTHIVETEVQQKKNYIGYYADVDGDGEADGVIYADLAHKKEETTWGTNGTYSYEAKEDIKEYTISENKYTGEKAKFGEKEIITLKPGSSGKERFYVMALEDFTTESYTTFYWYKEAHGDMTQKITKDEFGEGSNNTKLMIAKWKAAGTAEGYPNSPQNNQDIWKHIEGKYQEGWYIPSLGEWTAFADYFTSKEENPLTHDYESGSYVANSGNYSSFYGLSDWYWSSSQYDTYLAWGAYFFSGNMNTNGVNFDGYVRLGATF